MASAALVLLHPSQRPLGRGEDGRGQGKRNDFAKVRVLFASSVHAGCCSLLVLGRLKVDVFELLLDLPACMRGLGWLEPWLDGC